MTTLTPVTTRGGRVPTGKSKDGRKVSSNEDIVQYFVDSLLERTERPHLSVNSMIVDRDQIFSYGSHFCIAQIVRRSSGVPRLVLTNADTWSSQGWHGGSTSSHQHAVRYALGRVRDQLPANRKFEILEIPFSAVDAAGIDRRSIIPTDIRTSRYTTHEITSVECPGERLYALDDEGVPHYKTPTEITEGALIVDPKHSTVSHERRGMLHAHPTGHATLGDDGIWRWTVQRHWMGDSLIRGKSTERRSRKLTPDERERWDWLCSISSDVIEARGKYEQSFKEGVGYDEALRTQWSDLDEYRRELRGLTHVSIRVSNGEPGVEFSVQRWASYLSSFDYDEPHRPYFLCELPYACKATTVDEAVDALMPDNVRLKIADGIEVLRQGDVYAIPTGLSTDALLGIAVETTVTRYVTTPGEYHSTPVESKVKLRRPRAQETYEAGALDIMATNHRATHMIVVKHGGVEHWYGRGTLVHAPAHRDPDHRQVKLGDGETWYRFVKNTVPEATNGRRNTRSGAFNQSGISRAWTMSGAVD